MDTPSANANLDASIKANGPADHNRYDIEKTTVAQHEPAPASPGNADPNMKAITIMVPKDLPDGIAKAAWTIGMNAVQAAFRNEGTIAVPQDVPGPGGKPVRTVGQTTVLLRRAEDIQILIDFAGVITNCNRHYYEAAQKGTAEKIAAGLETNNIKKEALKQATAAVKGESNSIIEDATGLAPDNVRQGPGEKKTAGGIIITE